MFPLFWFIFSGYFVCERKRGHLHRRKYMDALVAIIINQTPSYLLPYDAQKKSVSFFKETCIHVDSQVLFRECSLPARTHAHARWLNLFHGISSCGTFFRRWVGPESMLRQNAANRQLTNRKSQLAGFKSVSVVSSVFSNLCGPPFSFSEWFYLSKRDHNGPLLKSI